jgi:isoaspartyl peptidase/L-asparaginase-like protein (Ntn-hydrolase superfamily)
LKSGYQFATKNIFGDEKGYVGHDTVGAVVLSADGNFAACTSTGGVTFKRVGRVGGKFFN